jgi:hypothetical protein
VLLRGIGPDPRPGALQHRRLLGDAAADPRQLGDDGDGRDGDRLGGGAALSTAFAEVAAFPLAAGSADSAMLQTLPAGSYTSTVSGVNSTTGIALAEIYDEDAQPATRAS